MRRISKSKLSTVSLQDDSELLSSDPRRQTAVMLSVHNDLVLEAVETALAGMPVLQDRGRMTALLASASEIHDQWGKVREGFLSIGRKLLYLDQLLSTEENDAFRREHQRILPFSHTVGVQLRQVALAVDNGRIPLELCPHGYSTAYQLAVMSDEELFHAREAGLIRPDVTRSRVIAFRRSLVVSRGGQVTRLSTSKLSAELDYLLEERRQSLMRLLDIKRRIREIKAKQREIGPSISK